VLEHEGDRVRVEPRVEGVEHAARHRHREMASIISGVLAAITATVSPMPIPAFTRASAS
jgi:hypothetical protein